MTKVISQAYLDGIREGRRWVMKHGLDDAHAHLDNLERTCRMFDASTDIGQLMRGERDFWRNQIRKA